MKLKPKLMTAFTLTVLVPVLIASGFSVTYFFQIIVKNTQANLQDKSKTAQLLFDLKGKELEALAASTAAENLVILNLELLLDRPVQTYLHARLTSSPATFLSILDASGILRISGNTAVFSVSPTPLFPADLLKLVAAHGVRTLNVRLDAEQFLTTEQITMRPAIAIVSLSPIFSYSKTLAGFVIAGYVLGEDERQGKPHSFLNDVRTQVHQPVLILRDNTPLVYSDDPLHATTFSFSGKTIRSADGSAVQIVTVDHQSYRYAFFPVRDAKNATLARIGVGVREDTYHQPRNQAALLLGVISLAGCGIAALIAYTFSERIARPVIMLMTDMKKVEDGDWDVSATVETDDEIGQLAATFNTMSAQLKKSFAHIEAQRNQLKQQNIELQRLDRLKDEFLSNTSHELRTPLNGIIGLADALLNGIDGPLTDAEQRHVGMIRQSSQRLTNLVNDLLDFSKLQARKVELNLTPFALSDVVEVVLEFAQELTRGKPVTLTADLPADLPEIIGDIDRVEQIVMNVVGNAIKFTQSGSVTVTARPEGDGVRISVQDTGIGIPAEAFQRIFTPFEQADGSITREFGGTGLGLSITKALVEQHGGAIWVESEVGKGSVFHITLPSTSGARAPETPAEQARIAPQDTQTIGFAIEADAPLTAQQSSAPSLTPSEPGTILVIDDDPANIEVLCVNLRHAGLTVLSAGDAHTAYDLIKTHAVDLILCDVMMPGIDGYTFAMTIQEQSASAQNIPPLMFVTAKDRREDRLKGYHVGALDYITKPIDPEELRWKVQALLRLKRRHTIAIQDDLVYTRDTVYAVESEDETADAVVKAGHGEKILVVDDEPVNLEVLRTLLAQYQYTVITASDGQEALQKIEQEPLDLVLLDLMMPKMSGFKVCKLLRKDARFHDLPVIMLTAKGGLHDKIYGLNIGANDYLIKPFNKDELLTKVAVFLRILTLQRELAAQNTALNQLNQTLERRVAERTQELARTNTALQESVETLQMAQDQLVQAEKMAALGTLVAGIAHEINTPVGIGVTAASYLEDQTDQIQACYARDGMSRSDLERYFSAIKESAGIILHNLQRAAEQIAHFKQVAVDHTSSEQRRFNLHTHLKYLLLSLKPKLKSTQHTLALHCPEQLEIMSYPGAFSQIFTNLIMNSLIHAFPEIEQGAMHIEVTVAEETLTLCYSDNGRGMNQTELTRIFDPFYTTKRGQGGTGLGLYIIYNLVTQQLHGSIHCESAPNRGATFIITLPLEASQSPDETLLQCRVADGGEM